MTGLHVNDDKVKKHLRWEFIKENKKVRKQESDQEKKKVFFLGRFFGRVLVFFFS